MSKFVQTRRERASAAFGALRAKGASMKTAVVVGTGAALASTHSFAISVDDLKPLVDQAASDAGAALTMGQLALLGVGVLLLGFGALYGLLKK